VSSHQIGSLSRSETIPALITVLPSPSQTFQLEVNFCISRAAELRAHQRWNDDVVEGNLGPRERRKRLVIGVVALILGLCIALASRPMSAVGYALVFVLFWIAGLGLFQAKEKT
jgi:hypothetical protein